MYIARKLSDIHADEIIRGSQKPRSEKKVLTVNAPIDLVNRNIYVYLECLFTGAIAQFVLLCEVEMALYGTGVGRFPVQIGKIDTLSSKRSLISMVNGGGSAVGNSANITLASPFAPATGETQINEVVLQPYQIVGKCDQIYLHCDGFEELTSTITGWRAMLICESFSP